MDTQLKVFNVNHFHNSVPESDKKRLSQAEQIAKYQDDKILQFMKANARKEGWTSWEIHSMHFPQMLETSVRRALTNNSYDEFNEEGTVYKTRERRMGGHGSTVSVWQYKPKK